MKKLFVLMFILFAFGFAQAQSNIEEVKIYQELFGAEKKEIVAAFIKLDSPAKEVFWTMYDEYENERKELGLARVDLLKKYADNYVTLDDAMTDELMKEMISLSEKNDKLISGYYGKFKKAVGVKPAAQFYQIEGYFLSTIRVMILEGIPFVGELEAGGKK